MDVIEYATDHPVLRGYKAKKLELAAINVDFTNEILIFHGTPTVKFILDSG